MRFSVPLLLLALLSLSGFDAEAGEKRCRSCAPVMMPCQAGSHSCGVRSSCSGGSCGVPMSSPCFGGACRPAATVFSAAPAVAQPPRTRAVFPSTAGFGGSSVPVVGPTATVVAPSPVPLTFKTISVGICKLTSAGLVLSSPGTVYCRLEDGTPSNIIAMDAAGKLDMGSRGIDKEVTAGMCERYLKAKTAQPTWYGSQTNVQAFVRDNCGGGVASVTPSAAPTVAAPAPRLPVGGPSLVATAVTPSAPTTTTAPTTTATPSPTLAGRGIGGGAPSHAPAGRARGIGSEPEVGPGQSLAMQVASPTDETPSPFTTVPAPPVAVIEPTTTAPTTAVVPTTKGTPTRAFASASIGSWPPSPADRALIYVMQFSGLSCPPCNKMKREFLNFLPSGDPLKPDVGEHWDFSSSADSEAMAMLSKFPGISLPTFVIIDQRTGRELKRVVGYHTKDQLQREYLSAIKAAKDLQP